MTTRRGATLALGAAALWLGAAAWAQDEPLRVETALETSRPSVGQAFDFRLQVHGSDAPDKPDLAALRDDFLIEDAGGGAVNSQSIEFVNGRIARTVRRGYRFDYRLTPKREGTVEIPSIEVRAEGRAAATGPLRLQVQAQREIQDFRLVQTLSERRAYVGQPVILTTTWYVGRNVEQFAFHLPLAADSRFEVFDPRRPADPSRREEWIDVPVGDTRAAARKGRGQLDGWEFVTVEFRKAIVPKQTGKFELEPAVVSFRAPKIAPSRMRGLFDDFFADSFFGGRRGYENFTIPAKPMSLEVLPLPAEGRPAEFSGLVGDFRFEASAAPAEVSVGDPITLTIRVAGPEYLDYVRLPDLRKQMALAAAFKVPEEMAAGELQASSKLFTQTIRAKDASATEIPPLEFHYFDPREGRYAVARTAAIPVEVTGARLLTLSEVEGASGAPPSASPRSAPGGIGANYEADDALDEWPVGLAGLALRPGWAAALLLPPLAYLALAGWARSWRRRLASAPPPGVTAALDELRALRPSAASDPAFAAALFERVRAYLGARLELPAGSLAYSDAAERLDGRGAGPETLTALRALFEDGEAARYGGGYRLGDSAEAMRERAVAVCEAIERALEAGR